MNERPILFFAPMVRAILEGRKTQTRRVLKTQPPFLARVRHCWFDAPIYGFTDDVNSTITDKWWKIRCPYGVPGDRLWVRETCAIFSVGGYVRDDVCFPSRAEVGIGYRADHKTGNLADGDGGYNFRTIEGDEAIAQAQLIAEAHYYEWRPSIFMPRWASRITLELTDVRVQRVQEISAVDAQAEGMESCTPYDQYRVLWDQINAKRGYPWSANPWVWALTFRRVQ